MTPEEEKELAELEELDRLEAEEKAASPADQAKAAELSPLIDPSLPIAPQVLSTQPATTHPGGDEAAQLDWVVKGTDSAKGTTVVLEPPLAVAKKELLENPQLLAALYPDEQIPPEFIQGMDEHSDIYKAYADKKWDDARWAAADSGQTAYRQARMPWLQGGEAAGLSPLSMLITKVKASAGPMIDGANAFVLGVDDTGAFGAGRAAGEALDRATGNPTDEINRMREEEYPGLNAAGKVAGLFTPFGVMGLLGKGANALTHGAGALAARAGGGAIAQGAAKLAGAGAAAVAGGSAAQAGREGVQAASSLERTGDAGTTLDEAANRSLEAGLDPMNLGLGVGGEAAGMVAGGLAKGIASLPRFGGNVERVEQLGGKIKLGAGPVGTKGTEAAERAGRARDITPQDVMAEQLAPKIAEAENAVASGNFAAAKQAKEDAKIAHGKFKASYFETPEGKQALPPVATMETNLKHLRAKMTDVDGKLRPVGNAEGVATARAELSGDVAKVSLKPEPGAIELSPEEAEQFLSPSLTHDLVPKPKAHPPAPPAPPKGGGTNPQGVNVIRGAEAPTVPPKGKAAKPAGKVEAIPDRDMKPTLPYDPGVAEARNEYGNAMAPVREGQRKSNATAAKLDKEFTPQLSPEKVKALRKQSDDVAAALSEGEVDAIRSFTSRHGDKVGSPEWKSAVKKLTVQEPTAAGPLFHGTRMPKQQLDEMLKNGSYATKGPTSLSYNKDLSDAFSHGRAARGEKVIFEIQQLKEGQNFLSPKLGIGRSGLEREINISNPAKFQVVSHSVDKEGVTHVILRDAAMAGATVGAALALGDDSGGAALASAGGLALALKKRGIGKVYAVPRRYDAQQHEVRIGQLKDLTKDPKMPGAREAKERYAAALKDRGQRSLGGKPGGWSEVQAQTAEKLTQLEEKLALAEVEAKKKTTANRDAPGGTAAKRLVRYSQQRPGELPLKKEIEAAGAKGGVLPQLNDLRLLDPLQQLKGAMTPRKSTSAGKSGIIGALVDQAALRGLYPGLRSAEGFTRGGTLGTRYQQLHKDKKEDEAQK